jgi:hypothetical protein
VVRRKYTCSGLKKKHSRNEEGKTLAVVRGKTLAVVRGENPCGGLRKTTLTFLEG